MSFIIKSEDRSMTGRLCWMWGVVAVIGAVALPERALGGHPMSAEDAGTAGAGVVEIELSGELAGEAERPRLPHLGLGLGVHAGIARGLDLGVGAAYELSAGADSAARLETQLVAGLDLKVALLSAGPRRPGVALKAAYRPPHRMKGHDDGHGVEGLCAASLELGSWSLHANLGVAVEGLGTGSSELSLAAASMVQVGLPEGLDAGLELLSAWSPHGRLRGLDATAGLSYRLHDALLLSLGAGPSWTPEGGFGGVLRLGMTATSVAWARASSPAAGLASGGQDDRLTPGRSVDTVRP
jgi:hypothetical protein